MVLDMRPFMMARPEDRVQRTPEDLHRMCGWCNFSSVFECKACACLRDCGKPLCPLAADMTEFQNPSLPRFS